MLGRAGPIRSAVQLPCRVTASGDGAPARSASGTKADWRFGHVTSASDPKRTLAIDGSGGSDANNGPKFNRGEYPDQNEDQHHGNLRDYEWRLRLRRC